MIPEESFDVINKAIANFKINYPNTMLSITEKGVKAFEVYVNDLKKYINPKK